jgi:hypothetical protein
MTLKSYIPKETTQRLDVTKIKNICAPKDPLKWGN